jgi:hypothetical protein
MKTPLLRQIITTLTKEYSCVCCGNSFLEDNVDIVYVVENRALFALYCSCSTAVVMVSQSISVTGFPCFQKRRRLSALSSDEFLSMKNTLKEFKGDFSGLFG